MPASIPSKTITYANVREERLYISTNIIAICESMERKAFLLVVSGEKKSVNRVRAPGAEGLTLNL